MKSVKSLIDRRQEIEQQLHAIAMRQPPSQTVASPDGHWSCETWGALMGTPPPNTVGHELLELEAA